MNHAKLAALAQAVQMANRAPLPRVLWDLLDSCKPGTPDDFRFEAFGALLPWLDQGPPDLLIDLATLLVGFDEDDGPRLYRALCDRVGV